MTSPTSVRKIVSSGTLMALALLVWVSFGPRQLGGSVSYVMTHGISMEPQFQEGDLVILRENAPYGEGDVIAYESAALKQRVMHRIVSKDAEGYVTKGDNNDWTDIDRPKDADVIGKEWMHVPGGGKILGWVASPRNAAGLAAIMALISFGGIDVSKRRRRRHKGTKMEQISIVNFRLLSVWRQAALSCVAIVGATALVVGFLSFTKNPVTASAEEAAYEHSGAFGYAADTRTGPVYRDGKVETGDPLFLKLIDDLEVSFTYNLTSEAPTDVGGSGKFTMVVKDANGWSKRFPLDSATEIKDQTLSMSGVVDPDKVLRLATRVQELTGIAGTTYTVSLEPTVAVEGTVDGEPFSDSFAPKLAFSLDGLQLKGELSQPTEPTPSGASDPYRPTLAGSVDVSELKTNSVGIAGLRLPIVDARKLAASSLLISILLGLLLWRGGRSVAPQDEAARIEALYGEWLVPLEGRQSQPGEKVLRVETMEALVRLADRYDRMILHEESNGTHTYVVEEQGVAYSYEVLPSTAAPSPSSHTDVPAPRLREELRRDQRDALRMSLIEQLRKTEEDVRGADTRTLDGD